MPRRGSISTKVPSAHGARGARRRAAWLLALLLPLPCLAGTARAAATPRVDGALSLNAALELALANDPEIALQQTQLDTAQGALLIAGSPFEPLLSLSSSRDQALTPLTDTTHETLTTLDENVGYSQKLRSGLVLQPAFDLAQTEISGLGTANVGTFSFTVRQPLLRGRGVAVADAPEIAARREVEASDLDLQQTIAGRLEAVAEQYWATRAAAYNLDILVRGEEDAGALLDTTRRLVQGDQQPAADLVQVEANLAAKQAARIGGDLAFAQARLELGRRIGLSALEIAALPAPGDPFPEVAPFAADPARERQEIELALRLRPDLRAARQRRSESQVLLRAARDQRKPQLDLVLGLSYAGVATEDGAPAFFSSFYSNPVGLSSSALLSLSWPVRGVLARGEVMQAEAADSARALMVAAAEKEIGAGVPSALAGVRQNALQLARASQAVELFQRAVTNEERKLRAGTSTLIDVITQRDRLTVAAQSATASRFALASSIAQLRFETGSLIAVSGRRGVVEVSRFVTLPMPESESP
jgi:outer membrane protein